jgi:hypothetical protein
LLLSGVMLLGKDNSGYVAESHAIAAAWAGFKGSVQQVAGGMYLYSRQLQQLLHSAYCAGPEGVCSFAEQRQSEAQQVVAGAQALQQLSSEVIDDIWRAGTTIVPGSAYNDCFMFDSELSAAVDLPSSSSVCCLENTAQSCLELLAAVSSQWELLNAALGEVSQGVVVSKANDRLTVQSSSLTILNKHRNH